MANKAVIHDIVVERLSIKATIDGLNKELKVHKSKLMELDSTLLQEMAEAQQTLTRIEGHTISVTAQDVFTPTDWTEFYAYCEENRCSYLFQRRLTQKAVEEMLAQDPDLPVDKFVKHSISMRKVSGG